MRGIARWVTFDAGSLRAGLGGMMLIAWCAIVAGGCQWQHVNDPLTVTLDRDRGVPRRLAALEQLGPLAQADEPAPYHEALRHLAWSDREPIELRRVAIDRLIAHDPAAFQREADRRITEVTDWAALRHIFDRAAARQWRAFTSVAVRSYARPTDAYGDRDRPEHALLAALHPQQPVAQTLYDVFLGMEDAHTLAHQMAAWRVLSRLLDRETLRARLDAAPPATALVRDLRAAASVLETLPERREQLLWLMRLREMDEGALWQRMARRASELTGPQRDGLALRHLPLLVHGRDETDALDRATLARRIARRLRDRDRTTRTTGAPRGEAWSESFEDHRDALPWGDLLAIDVIQQALDEHEVRRALFTQADADREDGRSEHGGALVMAQGRAHPRAFEPALRLHARRYVASPALIEQLHTALAHYHFHAQRYANAEYAGPGAGDLRFAARFGCHALVLTFIDRDTLNADYYQPDGIAVDLGHITRPK